MNLLGKVRRLYYREGLTLSEIERRTGLTRKTIRKWLKAPEGVEPKYQRNRPHKKTAGTRPAVFLTTAELSGWRRTW